MTQMKCHITFYQGLHCGSSEKEIQYFLEFIRTCDYPSLVLVQPRKNRPYITERLLMGRKESNQTNKQNKGPVTPQYMYNG